MSFIVVEQLQAFLVAQGIAQLPGTEPPGAKPSIWTMPRQGAAMPRTQNGEWLELQTITLNDAHLQGPPNQEAWLKDTFIDVIVRAKNAGEGKLTLRGIENLLHPVGKYAGRANWIMGELRVLHSKIWRSEQPLPPVENGLTYDRVASFRIQCARSDLG